MLNPNPVNSDEYKALTFNIHRGKTAFGVPSLNQIFEILKNENPDFIAIQEVDRYKLRTAFVDQISWLSEKLELEYVFGSNIQGVVSQYGNALLSKYPIIEWGQIPLTYTSEPRSLLWAKIQTNEGLIYITSIHLGLDTENRTEHFTKITEALSDFEEPVLLMGDFNVLPNNQAFLQFRSKISGQFIFTEIPTFVKNQPIQIDYIFGQGIYELQQYNIPTKASDHYPLILKFKLQKNSKSITIS